VQGRYFLPILPLALTVIALPRVPRRLPPAVILAVAAVCNAIALIRIYGSLFA